MIDWQTLIALAVVALSVALLLRRFLAHVKGEAKSGCGACPNKAAPPLMKTLPLVQLDSLKTTKTSKP